MAFRATYATARDLGAATGTAARRLATHLGGRHQSRRAIRRARRHLRGLASLGPRHGMGRVNGRAEPGRLVVRTAPMPGEHVLGYLLRLAEINDYKGPHWLPGFNQSKGKDIKRKAGGVNRAASSELEELTGVVGLQEALGGWRTPGRCSIGRGVSLPVQQVQLGWRKICPSCLEEARFLRAAWDLTHWVACPIHGRFMLQECPECRQPLGWREAKLDHCCRGTPLTAIRPAQAPEEVVGLMRALAACSSTPAPGHCASWLHG